MLYPAFVLVKEAQHQPSTWSHLRVLFLSKPNTLAKFRLPPCLYLPRVWVCNLSTQIPVPEPHLSLLPPYSYRPIPYTCIIRLCTNYKYRLNFCRWLLLLHRINIPYDGPGSRTVRNSIPGSRKNCGSWNICVFVFSALVIVIGLIDGSASVRMLE